MKKDLEFCKEDNLSVKQEIICEQDDLHKSMIDNPLSFILFYLFAIIFVGILFQLSQRKVKAREKKNK